MLDSRSNIVWARSKTNTKFLQVAFLQVSGREFSLWRPTVLRYYGETNIMPSGIYSGRSVDFIFSMQISDEVKMKYLISVEDDDAIFTWIKVDGNPKKLTSGLRQKIILILVFWLFNFVLRCHQFWFLQLGSNKNRFVYPPHWRYWQRKPKESM